MDKKQHNNGSKELRFLQLGDLEIREVISEDGTGEQSKTVGGYVVKYNMASQMMEDRWGDKFIEVISESAFNKSLEAKSQKALWNHNTDLILGSVKSGTLNLYSDNIGLRCEINLPNTRAGSDAYESIKRGDVDGMSFGFRCLNDMWSIVEIDGQEAYKRTILEAELIEVSPTIFPAYPDSAINCRSLEDFKTEKIEAEKARTNLINELLIKTYL